MKKIYMQKPDGQTTALGEADSSFPDEIIVRDAKAKFGQDAKIGIEETEDTLPGTNGLSLQMNPSPLPTAPDMSDESRRKLMELAGNVVDAGLSAAKIGIPMAVGAGMAAASPLALGTGLAASYLAPEAAQLLLRYGQGKPVGEKELLQAAGGTAGMFAGGALGQVAPKAGQYLIEKGYGPVSQNLGQWSAEFLANLTGDVVQKGIEQQTVTPELSKWDVGISGGLAGVSFRPSLAKSRGNLLAKELDSTVANLAVQLPGVREEDLRPIAAILHDDPAMGARFVELAKQDPTRIPKLVDEAKRIAQAATADLAGTSQAGSMMIPAREGDFPAQARELKSGLEQFNQYLGQQADTGLRSELERLLKRPLTVTEAEATAAHQALQTQAARKVALEAQALKSDTDARVLSLLQSVAPGVTREEAIEGTAKLGEKAIDMVKSSMLAKGALKNNAYSQFYSLLDQTPAINNAAVPRFNDVEQSKMLEEIKEALSVFGTPNTPVDIRNVIRRFFPEVVGEPESTRTVGDFVRSMPAMNAAFDAAYSMTGKDQLRDRGNMLYILSRLKSAVNKAVDPALSASPELKTSWDNARQLMSEYGDARSTFFAFDNLGKNTVGEKLTFLKTGMAPEDEFKRVYEVLGSAGAKDLKNAEKRNLIAQILHSSADPKAGGVDPDKVLQKLYENENKLGDTYALLSRFLSSPGYQGRVERVKALEGAINGNLFSRVATDIDPELMSFAQSLNPQTAATAKAIALDSLLKKARTPEGGFDMNAIVNDPRVQKILKNRKAGGVSAFPELDALLSGSGARLAVNDATFVSEVLKRHGFTDIDKLFDTFLNSADIGGKEVRAFKEVVTKAFPGQAGANAWADLRNTFWQRMLFNPETGSPRFDRWLNATETGYPREFLAEMAGAGTRVFDPKTNSMKVLTESEALSKVDEWSKHIRKLRDYSDVIMAEIRGGINPLKLEQLKKQRKDEDLFSFMGGTLSTSLLGMYSAGASRYFLAKLAQLGIKEHWNNLREARLFSSAQDHLTDKLASAEKAFARAVKTMINSKLLQESGQEPTQSLPQPNE